MLWSPVTLMWHCVSPKIVHSISFCVTMTTRKETVCWNTSFIYKMLPLTKALKSDGILMRISILRQSYVPCAITRQCAKHPVHDHSNIKRLTECIWETKYWPIEDMGNEQSEYRSPPFCKIRLRPICSMHNQETLCKAPCPRAMNH